MKKRTKAAIIIAVSFIVVGIILFTATMFTLGFDFSKLDNAVYVTNTYEHTNGISHIGVDIGTADIKVLPTTDDTLKVVCNEKEDYPHKVEFSNNTLTIKEPDKKWYDYLTFANLDHSEITLYVPERFVTTYIMQSDSYSGALYSSVNRIDIETDTGNIYIEDIKFSSHLSAESNTGNISVSNCFFDILNTETDTGTVTISKTQCVKLLETEVTTGDTNLKQCYAKEITSEASTGHITFNDVNASKTIKTETSTGDITFKDCDALYIHATSSTGDITGTILSAKTFKAESATGKVSVPGTTAGSTFEAKTSTGDIFVTYSDK